MADQKLKLGRSTQIHGATYDPATERLTVDLNGGTFAYHNVKKELADGLSSAPSHGDFFHQHIRNNHEFTRVK